MKKIIHLLVTLIFTFACTPVFAEEAVTNCEDGSNCDNSSIVTEGETDPVTEDDGTVEPLIISEETPSAEELAAEEEAEEESKTWTTPAIIVACVFLVLIIAAYIFTIKK